jgi:hypothetical protein
MATIANRRHGKTEFVKQVLAKNPRANAAAVNDAWTAAGKGGTISATLVNKLRSALGLTGNLRARRKKNGILPSTKPPYTGKKRGRKPKNFAATGVVIGASQVNGLGTAPATSKGEARVRAGFHLGTLEQLEADIDRLLFKVMSIGGLSAIEDSLRQARRLLYGGFAGKRQ